VLRRVKEVVSYQLSEAQLMYRVDGSSQYRCLGFILTPDS